PHFLSWRHKADILLRSRNLDHYWIHVCFLTKSFASFDEASALLFQLRGNNNSADRIANLRLFKLGLIERNLALGLIQLHSFYLGGGRARGSLRARDLARQNVVARLSLIQVEQMFIAAQHSHDRSRRHEITFAIADLIDDAIDFRINRGSSRWQHIGAAANLQIQREKDQKERK